MSNPRHPAFEKAIDENPLDSNNHLVYADWLEEQGDHTEAHFRRSLGEWIRREGKRVHNVGKPHPWGEILPWTVDMRHLPDGVNSDHIQRDLVALSDHPETARLSWPFLEWQDFRGMESAFRKAHKAPDRYSRHYSKLKGQQ